MGTAQGSDRHILQDPGPLPPRSPTCPLHPGRDNIFTCWGLSGGQPGLGWWGCLAQLCFLGLLLGALSLLLGPALRSQLCFALAPRGLLTIVGAIGQGW